MRRGSRRRWLEDRGQECLDGMAKAFAEGGSLSDKECDTLARRLHMPPQVVRNYRDDPSFVNKVVKPMIQAKATLAIGAALPGMAQAAKESPVAFGHLAKVADLGSSGMKNEVNVTIDRRNGGNNESAIAFIERFRERGLRRVAEDVKVIENGDHSPD